MRKLSLVGGVAATLMGATVVLAAAPAPSIAPAATPAPAVAPTTTPSTAAPTVTAPKVTAPAASAATPTWSASVQPLVLEGTATFTRAAEGTAILTMKMHGLAPGQPWSVTVVPGTTGTFGTRRVLFRWTASDLDRLGADTLRVHLTAAEYHSIAHARSTDGFLIIVSDGTNQSIASFAKA
jgi:hypothetical protein